MQPIDGYLEKYISVFQSEEVQIYILSEKKLVSIS